MAIPRVFISSTYYDLKYIRNDIESFIKNLGYEPVLHEKNKITYTQTSSLEDSCYNEISLCDILICIIGNKYGTKSGDNDYSITMNELLNAIRDKKKIYVFIQKDVSIENNTYLRNKDLVDFKPFAADNIKIHEFIAELKTNNNNFPIQDFESVLDITNSIKDQFAGLFQNLLQNESTITNEKTYYDLVDTSNEIKNLVKSGNVKQTLHKRLSVFSVVKYSKYQDLPAEVKQESLHRTTTIYTNTTSIDKNKISLSSMTDKPKKITIPTLQDLKTKIIEKPREKNEYEIMREKLDAEDYEKWVLRQLNS